MNESTIERLREKASQLPLHPGVYIMKNADGKVIYVGKSSALKNRVSQYFAIPEKHEIKTRIMVYSVSDFEYILTDTEMEALTVENKLIKLYQPKFNIKLKDDKNYPYIKIDIGSAYPSISIVRKRSADKAKYFGPYSGTSAAYEIINTVRKNFGVANCKRKFPHDIGKERPCIYYQIGRCCGVCTGNVSPEEYKSVWLDAISFLNGSFSGVKRSLEKKMYDASEKMNYELAAKYRDRINALQKLWEKQKVSSDPDKERDVIAVYGDELCTCMSVLCIRGGALCDSLHYEFSPEQIDDTSDIVSFICELYNRREYIPKEVLLDFKPDDGDMKMLEDYLRNLAGYSVCVRSPQKSEPRALCSMAYDNAKQHALSYSAEKEKDGEVLIKLAKTLCLEVVPEKIEAYDISNFGNDNITAGMVCVKDGKFSRSDYRLFNIKGTKVQDDYLSMREAISRRLSHTENTYPDLILLDGGRGHVNTVKELLCELNVDIPVFGMVKDEYHKTRTLTDGSSEIGIAYDNALFIFIYKLQEEVHRFTISRMKKAKGKKLTESALKKIDGIGAVKAKDLLLHFKSVSAIADADITALMQVRGIGKKDAENIYEYFKDDKGKVQPI